MEPDFRSAFCARYKCKDEEFEKVALLKVLHRRALPLAWIILIVAPSYFTPDFQILRHFGSLTRKSNLYSDALDVRNDYARLQASGFLRRSLKMRISGQRLLKVASEIWHPSNGQTHSAP